MTKKVNQTQGSGKLQEKLHQEIADLRRKDAEQLLKIEDHAQFLHNYPWLPCLRESTYSLCLQYFEDVVDKP